MAIQEPASADLICCNIDLILQQGEKLEKKVWLFSLPFLTLARKMDLEVKLLRKRNEYD